MTMPQIESYITILSGKTPSGNGRRLVPARRKTR